MRSTPRFAVEDPKDALRLRCQVANQTLPKDESKATLRSAFAKAFAGYRRPKPIAFRRQNEFVHLRPRQAGIRASLTGLWQTKINWIARFERNGPSIESSMATSRVVANWMPKNSRMKN